MPKVLKLTVCLIKALLFSEAPMNSTVPSLLAQMKVISPPPCYENKQTDRTLAMAQIYVDFNWPVQLIELPLEFFLTKELSVDNATAM